MTFDVYVDTLALNPIETFRRFTVSLALVPWHKPLVVAVLFIVLRHCNVL